MLRQQSCPVPLHSGMIKAFPQRPDRDQNILAINETLSLISVNIISKMAFNEMAGYNSVYQQQHLHNRYPALSFLCMLFQI